MHFYGFTRTWRAAIGDPGPLVLTQLDGLYLCRSYMAIHCRFMLQKFHNLLQFTTVHTAHTYIHTYIRAHTDGQTHTSEARVGTISPSNTAARPTEWDARVVSTSAALARVTQLLSFSRAWSVSGIPGGMSKGEERGVAP